MENRKKRKVYKGSTMLIVLVAISFIALIGTIVTFTAYTNLMLKKLESKNKQSFYTAESVVDELYTGVGMSAMDNISEAYVYILANREVSVGTGIFETQTEANNAELNEKMRKKFIQFIMEDMGGKDSVTQAYLFDASVMENSTGITYDYTDSISEVPKNLCDNVKASLNTMIKESANAQVTSISGVEVHFYKGSETESANYSVVIRDANVHYKQDSLDDYFSEVTVDFVIEYPAITVTFDNTRENMLESFKDYVFIASSRINFNSVGVTNVNSGMFAGNNGLNFNNATVNLRGSAVITTGNITVYNNTFNDTFRNSTINFLGSRIWAQNLIVDSGYTKKPNSYNAKVTIDGDSSTYLSDDFQIDAGYANVSIGGNYWGYGTNTISSDPLGSGHLGDSSIIVNGKGSVLTLTDDLDTLLLAGKAYVHYNEDNMLWPTAEAVALKGNQRYYLMPNSCLEAKYVISGVNYDTAASDELYVEQPMNNTVYNNVQYTANENMLKSFFAYELLNKEDPITQKAAGIYEYAYMNFANNQARNDYLECLIRGESYTVSYFANKGISLTDVQLNSYREMVEYTKKFLQTVQASTIIQANPTSLYTTGLLLNYNSANGNLSSGASIGGGIYGEAAENTENALYVTEMKTNFENRLNILSHILLEIPEYEVDATGNTIYRKQTVSEIYTYKDGSKTYTIDPESYNKSVFDNLIDSITVKSSPIIGGTTAAADGEYVCVYDGDVVIPPTAKYGAVIATGNVTVQGSFAGIIISNGIIDVEQGGTYSTDISAVKPEYTDLIHYLTTCKDGALVNYIIPLQGAYSFGENNDQIGKIKYTDLVTYTNWRKTVGE